MDNSTLIVLDESELKSVEGGWIGIAIGVAVSVGLWTLSEWDCLVEGYEEARK